MAGSISAISPSVALRLRTMARRRNRPHTNEVRTDNGTCQPARIYSPPGTAPRSKARKDNKSGVLGVFSCGKRWQAQIRTLESVKYPSRRSMPRSKEAKTARDEAARRLHWRVPPHLIPHRCSPIHLLPVSALSAPKRPRNSGSPELPLPRRLPRDTAACGSQRRLHPQERLRRRARGRPSRPPIARAPSARILSRYAAGSLPTSRTRRSRSTSRVIQL